LDNGRPAEGQMPDSYGSRIWTAVRFR
jgi:hypothetical protein